jgi:hypothetical protein
MAQTFLGNLTTVWINTDTTNVDPNARTFVQVENLSAFPSFSESTTISTVETYDSTYTSKVAGDSSYGDMTIEVNYVPGENAVLDSVVDSQQLVQVKVEMLDEGTNDTTVNYVLYNGYLSSVSDTSDMDQVVTRSYVFTPETQVSAGILDESVVPLTVVIGALVRTVTSSQAIKAVTVTHSLRSQQPTHQQVLICWVSLTLMVLTVLNW